MEEEADEFVEVADAAGTGLSWDIPRKEGRMNPRSSLCPGREGDFHCGQSVLSGEGLLGSILIHNKTTQ